MTLIRYLSVLFLINIIAMYNLNNIHSLSILAALLPILLHVLSIKLTRALNSPQYARTFISIAVSRRRFVLLIVVALSIIFLFLIFFIESNKDLIFISTCVLLCIIAIVYSGICILMTQL